MTDLSIEYSPFQIFRTACTSYLEWGKYMHEIYTRKFDNITSFKSDSEKGLDLMGAMIRHSGMITGTPNHGKEGAGLTQSEIMGNSFVMFLAGHETAANSIHFAVLFLATRPDVQKKLHGTRFLSI
jgi:cytochrome P450